MKRTYQAWEDETGYSLMSLGEVERLKALDTFDGVRLLFEIEAYTPEEAGAIFNLRMGWGPYFPIEPAKPCPRGCGNFYYPRGSGECPECGPIR